MKRKLLKPQIPGGSKKPKPAVPITGGAGPVKKP